MFEFKRVFVESVGEFVNKKAKDKELGNLLHAIGAKIAAGISEEPQPVPAGPSEEHKSLLEEVQAKRQRHNELMSQLRLFWLTVPSMLENDLQAEAQSHIDQITNYTRQLEQQLSESLGTPIEIDQNINPWDGMALEGDEEAVKSGREIIQNNDAPSFLRGTAEGDWQTVSEGMRALIEFAKACPTKAP
eukprot:GHVO01004666.1.p1 GENE.GHVO01004666.1~~GHVO01004666.1.p1  ORF type:complete len:199 (-),score=29.62 GHVO01004666.1:102-668(-)